MGWTGLARVVQGLSVFKDEDFVVAARVSGTGEIKIIYPPSAFFSQSYHNVCNPRSSGHDLGNSSWFSRYWVARTSGKLGCAVRKRFRAMAMLALPGLLWY